MDAISIARYGVMAAERRFEATASRVAQAGGDEAVDLGREVVEMTLAKHAFSANLNVIKFADEMWRALLDLQAR